MTESERAMNTAPPIIEDYDIEDMFSDVARPRVLTVESATEELEDVMLRTYLQVMKDTESPNRLRAASDVADILGKKGKKSVTIVNADNAQINQQQVLPPEMQKHLLTARDGLETLSSATDAKLKIQPGGRGA